MKTHQSILLRLRWTLQTYSCLTYLLQHPSLPRAFTSLNLTLTLWNKVQSNSYCS